MDIYILLVLFILGTIFGSFASVLIWRTRWEVDLDALKWILYWRSACPSCNTKLWAFDLIPIFSWMFQWASCRYCKKKISFFYPSLEYFSGLVFLFTYLYLYYFIWLSTSVELWIYYLYFVVINWLMLLLIFFDILFFRLNVYLWIFLTLWIILWQFLWILWDFQVAFWWGLLFVWIYAFLYFFAKYYVYLRFGLKNTEWLGEWDVMFAFTVWLMSYFLISDFIWIDILYLAFSYIILSSIIWILFYFLSYLFFNKSQWNSIPFLPAMIIAFWLFIFYWDLIIDFLKY